MYSYLLPTNGHVVSAKYAIRQFEPAATSDDRDLGFVLFRAPAMTVQPVGASRLPALPFLTLVLLAPLGSIALRAWRVGWWRWLAVCALALAIVRLYRTDPATVLVPSLAIGQAFLGAAGCGWLCQRLVAAEPDAPMQLVLWSFAATIAPWLYILSGLWINLGPQWLARLPLLWAALLPPTLIAIGLLALPQARRYRWWLSGIAVLCVALWGARNLWQEFSEVAFDFHSYWEAAQRFLGGMPIYEVAGLTTKPFSGTYKYHPLFLLFVLPLTQLSLDGATWLWRVVSLLCLIASVVLIVRSRPREQRPFLAALGLVLLLNLAPLTLSIRLGQVDALLLIGLVAALRYQQPAYRWASALLWGLLGLIKIYPLALLLADGLRWRWRYLLGIGANIAGLSIISGLIFGWANQRTFWYQVFPNLGARTSRLSNQSLYGLLARLVDPGSTDSGNTATWAALAARLHAVAGLAILAVVIVLLWRRRWLIDQHRLEIGSWLICTTLLLPVSWDHYQTILLLPLLCAGAQLARPRSADGLLLIGAYALLAFGTFKNVQTGLISSPLVVYFASYRTIGLGLLWLWWGRWLWRQDHAIVLPTSFPLSRSTKDERRTGVGAAFRP